MFYLSSMADLIRRIFNNPIISHSNKYMSTKALHKTASVGFGIFFMIPLCLIRKQVKFQTSGKEDLGKPGSASQDTGVRLLRCMDKPL